MLTKQDIIIAIQKSAKENGGTPLGMARFEQETGIKVYNWKKYWAKFGDAQKEAGFEPNQLQSGYTDEFVIEKVISVIRKLAKFPTFDELAVEKNNDSEFPNRKVFTKFGSKQNLVLKVIEYCKGKNGYEDIIKLCEEVSEKNYRTGRF